MSQHTTVQPSRVPPAGDGTPNPLTLAPPATAWHRFVAATLPVEGTRCTVIAESGDERTLIWKHNLWWLPDMEMYVYFTPVFWRAES